MIKIIKEQVILLHDILIKHSGGASGLRDEGLLESSIAAPYAEFGGIPLCDTIQRKAAKLCFSLVKNHPFIDGNKRIGILTMLTLLELNAIPLNCNDTELIKLGWDLANGTINEDDVHDFIINHNR